MIPAVTPRIGRGCLVHAAGTTWLGHPRPMNGLRSHTTSHGSLAGAQQHQGPRGRTAHSLPGTSRALPVVRSGQSCSARHRASPVRRDLRRAQLPARLTGRRADPPCPGDRRRQPVRGKPRLTCYCEAGLDPELALLRLPVIQLAACRAGRLCVDGTVRYSLRLESPRGAGGQRFPRWCGLTATHCDLRVAVA